LNRQEFLLSSNNPAKILTLLTLIVSAALICLQARITKGQYYEIKMNDAEKYQRWDQAIQFGRKAYSFNPYRQDTLTDLGRVYLDTKNPAINAKEAESVLRKAIHFNPYQINALLELGNAFGVQKKYKEAFIYFDKVLAIKQDLAKCHSNMGHFYMLQDKTNQAIKKFMEAVSLDPENIYYLYNLGTAYWQLGNRPRAIEAFKKARKLDLNHELKEKIKPFLGNE